MFLFFRKLQSMASASDDALYHQTKTPISFLYKQGLNTKSLTQPSETLPVKLTRTHKGKTC